MESGAGAQTGGAVGLARGTTGAVLGPGEAGGWKTWGGLLKWGQKSRAAGQA